MFAEVMNHETRLVQMGLYDQGFRPPVLCMLFRTIIPLHWLNMVWKDHMATVVLKADIAASSSR
jgi:hypothetical protein